MESIVKMGVASWCRGRDCNSWNFAGFRVLIFSVLDYMENEMSHKRNLYLIGFICFLALGLTAAINSIIDPAHLFGRSRYEAGIADILLSGKNVANVSNYDERLLQKYFIEGATADKQVIVLGSSRTMQITSNCFPGQTFCNYCVSGATLEDDLSIFSIYERKGFISKTVIIGVDPWLLNKNNDQARWLSLQNEYLTASKRLGLNASNNSSSGKLFTLIKFRELISLPYLKASFQKWRQDLESTSTSYYATNDMEADVPIRLIDGSYSYDYKYRNRNVEEVKRLASDFANSNPIYSLREFSSLDPAYQNIFETFAKDLHERGIRVILLMIPYHPAVYSTIKTDQKYQMVLCAQRYFEEFGKREGIEVYGSYDPAICMLTENDFYDGMHPKQSAISKIVKHYIK
jgi:hypothetical protein